MKLVKADSLETGGKMLRDIYAKRVKMLVCVKHNMVLPALERWTWSWMGSRSVCISMWTYARGN